MLLLRKSEQIRGLNQEEILNYLKDALSISVSETKKEAESKWRPVMNKATELTKDVETIQKL